MNRNVLLSYTGPFTQEAVVESGQSLRALPGLSDAARHRLFAVFVELAQNIGRYSAERAGPSGAERGAGKVEVLDIPAQGVLCVVATNLASVATGECISTQLASLSALDAEGLKKLHRERRRSAPPPGSLGAGLGLIEIARQATEPPTCSCEAGPDQHVHLSLKVVINRD